MDEMTEKYGVSEVTIRAVVKEYKIGLRNPRLPIEIKQQVATDYQSGLLTIKQISEKYKITGSTVEAIAEEFQIPQRLEKNCLNEEAQLQVALDYEAGMPTPVILEKYNISRMSLSRIVRNFQLNLNPRLEIAQGAVLREIINEYLGGRGAKDLSEKYRVSYINLRRQLINLNIWDESRLKGNYRLTKDQLITVERLAREGYTLQQIADQFSDQVPISASAIAYALNDLGVQTYRSIDPTLPFGTSVNRSKLPPQAQLQQFKHYTR